MDLQKMELMSTDALRAIRDKAIAVLNLRLDNSLRQGSIVSFKDRDGSTRYLRVNRVSGKSVSGVECDPVTYGAVSTARWRVGITLLSVVANPGVKPVAPPKPATPYRPTTAPESA
jgi:hypothetical protein